MRDMRDMRNTIKVNSYGDTKENAKISTNKVQGE
jgi:hypothetical protein